MRSRSCLVFLICTFCSIGLAQEVSGKRTNLMTATGPGDIMRARGAAYHKIAWTISGAPATCLVKLEKSDDGATWSDLIAAQSCTSDGASALTAGAAAYVRANVTGLSLGGELTASWTGYSDAVQSRAAQVATGSVLTLASADVAINWSQAMPDARYAVACGVVETSALGLGLLVERVRAVTASGVTVQVYNKSAGSLSGTVHCIAAWPGTQP